MPYRSDEDAVEARRLEITRELNEVRSRADKLDYLKWRAKELEAELAALEKAKVDLAAAKRLPMLASAKIASPCNAGWHQMVGDDRTRFCAGCKKNVYDLTALTTAEAEALLIEKEGNLCVRLYRRADGTVLTADCPVGLRRKWLTRSVNVALLAAGAATLAVLGVQAMHRNVDAPLTIEPALAAAPQTTQDPSAGMLDAPKLAELQPPDPTSVASCDTPHLQHGKHPPLRRHTMGMMVRSK